MDEKVFLQQGGVLVSSSRVEIGGQTFATRNIGSVKVISPGISWIGVLMTLVGLAMAFSSKDSGAVGLGVVLAAGGAYWVYNSIKRRELKLVAGGGEVLALKSTNPTMVEQVRSAIADAISVR